MSLYEVSFNLTRLVPNTPLPRAQTAVSRALGDIYEQADWSFQKGRSGWLAPGVLFNVGSFTTTPYSDQIIADATATAALVAYTGMPLITQLQYRNPAYSIYSIIGYDYNTINPGFVTLTLDRPWMEPTTGPGQPFMIYQVYFPAPVEDFSKFVSIQDFTNYQYIDFWSASQADLSMWDPQRLNFAIPRFAVPAGYDPRPGSATYGWPWFELWPHQGNYCPYNLFYRRRGALPKTLSDWMTMTTPMPITENMLEFKAKQVLFQDAAAALEAKIPAAGKGMMLLSTMAAAKYDELFSKALSKDLNLDGESLTHVHHPVQGINGRPFATMSKSVNLGGYSGRGGN